MNTLCANYLPEYSIFQMVPLLSSDTYNDPSGPCASPQGRYFALPVLPPANPSANTSHLPEGRPFLNGTNTTKKPACGSGARFQEPWKAMNAPLRYFSGN